MSYYRRRYTTRRRYNYRRRPAQPSKTTRRFVRSTVRRAITKTHPLQWVDIIFDGGNVNTSPTMHSLVEAVLNKESRNTTTWSNRNDGISIDTKECKYRITYIHYQLRFQQDQENIESSNTFRTLMYSHELTHNEDDTPILDNLNIDMPPQTLYVKSMYFDRIRTIRPTQYIDYTAENTEESAPGTSIIKGNKRVNMDFVFNETGDDAFTWDEHDIRWEAQSDTVGVGLQLYGFIRVYYRRMQ